MEHQIANAVKNFYYQIRNTGRIRPHLTKESYKTLGHSLVTSLLNCGNALLCGLPQTALQRLQNVQNCVARFITRTRKYEHITSVLQRLHWLLFHLGPTYKVLLFTYCALNGLVPDYLAELISYRPINRTLRSASLPALLFVPDSLTVTHGDRRFALCSAVLWNNLTPSLGTASSLQVFKTLFKNSPF